MKIALDKLTGKVAGVNLQPNPLLMEIEVPEDFKLRKTVYVQDGEKQKTNSEGQPLYLKEVFRTETIHTVIGQNETIEDTGRPIMENIQKTDSRGAKLYLEPIFDTEGEIVDYVEVTSPTDENGAVNEPSMIEVQKTSVKGVPLFWKDVVDTTYREVFDHTEETTKSREVIAWENKEVTVQELVGYEKIADPETMEPTGEDDLDRPIYQDKVITVKEPTEFAELPPVMVPNRVLKIATLAENLAELTSEDIVEAKYSAMLSNIGDRYILADEFFTEDEIDYTKPKLANTGTKLMELLPNGEITFNPIALEATTKTLRLVSLETDGAKFTVNAIEAVDGVYSLPVPTSEVILRLYNPTYKKVWVNAYALTYNEGV